MSEARKAIAGRAGWNVPEWAEAVGGICRRMVYKEIEAGRAEAVKLGSRTIIVTPPRDYLARLPKLPARTTAAAGRAAA